MAINGTVILGFASGYPLTALIAVMGFSAMLVSGQIWMARPRAGRLRRLSQRGQRAFAD